MATKIYNINEMRDAIVFSHNEGLKKAIDKNVCNVLGVDITYFNAWVEDVKKLKSAVDAYVKIKKDPNTPKDKELKKKASAARKEIYPLWKALLENGEAAKDKTELHADPLDVESLVGYDEEFCYIEGKGRAETLQTDQLFRKKVEFLLGCKIAQQQFMDEDKRELVNTYQGALKAITTNEQRIKEIDKQIEYLASVKSTLPDVDGIEDTIAFFDVQIKDLEKARQEANKRIDDANKTKSERANEYNAFAACYELAKYNKIVDVQAAKDKLSKKAEDEEKKADAETVETVSEETAE